MHVGARYLHVDNVGGFFAVEFTECPVIWSRCAATFQLKIEEFAVYNCVSLESDGVGESVHLLDVGMYRMPRFSRQLHHTRFGRYFSP